MSIATLHPTGSISITNYSTEVLSTKASPASDEKSTLPYFKNLDLSSRTQIIILRVLASTSGPSSIILGGLLLAKFLSVTPVGVIICSTLFAIAVGSLACSFCITDYDDPEVIETFRKEAESLDWDQIMQKHSLENVLRYEILSPSRFEALYIEKVKDFSFNQILSFYQELQEAIDSIPPFLKRDGYEVPHPERWKDLWHKETKSKTCEDIFIEYSLKDLKKYQIVTDQQKTLLSSLQKHYGDCVSEYKKTCKLIHEEYYRSTSAQRSQLEEDLEKADQTYKGCFAHKFLLDINSQYDQEKAKIEEKKHVKIVATEKEYIRLQSHLTKSGEIPISRLAPDQKKLLEETKKKELVIKQEIESWVKESLAKAAEKFRGLKASYAETIFQAEQEREKFIKEAENKFEDYTIAPRAIRDEHLEQARKTFRQKIDDINLSYDKFRVLYPFC